MYGASAVDLVIATVQGVPLTGACWCLFSIHYSFACVSALPLFGGAEYLRRTRFLGKVRDIKPDVTRIILTGYADKENAIKAINEVGLFQYVEKPWDNDNLQLVIRNGIEQQQLLASLRGKVDEINKAYAGLQQIQADILKTFA